MADDRAFGSYHRPWYRWYPKDWRSSAHVQQMSLPRQGFYREALDWAWELDGLPDDVGEIRRLFKHVDVRSFRRHWSVISLLFPRHPDGKLRNIRQEIERQKMRLASEKASKMNKSRWAKDAPGITQGIQPRNPTQTQTQIDPDLIGDIGNPYIPPLSISGKPKAVRSGNGEAKAQTPGAEPELHTRARRLLEELYPQWYSRYRNGAKLRPIFGPSDFEQALDLCGDFDDARLAKLARIVLETDEEWVASTDRRFYIFWKKAWWADERLATEEAKAKERAR